MKRTCEKDGCGALARTKGLCRKHYQAAWHHANREDQLAKQRAWREANSERKAAATRAWEKANPDKVRASRKRQKRKLVSPEWIAAQEERAHLDVFGLRRCSTCGVVKQLDDFPFYRGVSKGKRDARCRSCRAAHRRDYYALAKDRIAAYQRGNVARQARTRAAFVERIDRRVVFIRDGGVCGICGGRVKPTDFELDHIRPIARGGEHSYANVHTAHRECNRRKGDRLPNEMAAVA